MRTTIRLDDQLLKEVKQFANRTGKSLSSVIEHALRESLSRQHGFNQREPVRLATAGGRELLPGVDLDDSAALLDVMEPPDDPR